MALLSPGAATATALAQPQSAAADNPAHPAAPVTLRRLPYPYRAMLAIASDLDETPDRHAYLESMRYLNTTETTSAGTGVGLEVGNSIYFDMAPDQFAYWNTDDAGRAAIRALIQTGHVDVLHSFGDLATTRAHAARALDELSRHGCRLAVWVDHAVAPTNFGADIMAGQGDAVGSAAYHADLTCAYGIRFVWRGRVTSVLGQDIPRQLGGIFDRDHPLSSIETLGREFVKGVWARAGSGKYAMHAPNATLRRTRLRDDREIWEFLRCNPHWGGVSSAETAAGIGDVLTPAMLDRLVAREGVAILYTHLGKGARADSPFPPRSRAALQDLAGRRDAGAILVTTTRRVLGYRAASENARLSSTSNHTGLQVDLAVPDATVDSADWQGLSVYVPDSATARL
ncbi:MAG: hypothetical protein ABJC89_27060, partial [Acidobacteriota bacterium]